MQSLSMQCWQVTPCLHLDKTATRHTPSCKGSSASLVTRKCYVRRSTQLPLPTSRHTRAHSDTMLAMSVFETQTHKTPCTLHMSKYRRRTHQGGATPKPHPLTPTHPPTLQGLHTDPAPGSTASQHLLSSTRHTLRLLPQPSTRPSAPSAPLLSTNSAAVAKAGPSATGCSQPRKRSPD